MIAVETSNVLEEFNEGHEIAIAVVGLSGCGKSTFISEDAKAHEALGIEALFASRRTFPPAPFRYSRHFDWVIPCDFPMVIYELDIVKVLHENLPPVSGVVVCYDAANKASFSPVEEFLRRIRPLKLLAIAVALKTNLDVAVDPQESSNLLKTYDVGLVQVGHLGEEGRARITKVFNWLTISILPGPRKSTEWYLNVVFNPIVHISDADLRNPASPHACHSPITSTPTISSTPISTQIMSQDQGSSLGHPPTSTLPSSLPPIIISLTRAGHSGQYATLEELLDKVLFLAVSGDDPTFISHFLLTYRRFASPRSILLAMQKRMRQLDNSTGDPMFASYAQMRICNLLETWTQAYPQDFAVPGAPGALHALIPVDESEDPYSISEGEEETLVIETESPSTSRSLVARLNDNFPSAASVRERKSSLPLSAKIFIPVNSSHSQGDAQDIPPKDLLNKLRSNAQTLANFDCSAIAEEITRVELKLFMDIEPRHWLQYTLMPGRKDPEVVSLILCHDKPRSRARQIERLMDIAHELRALNNYSALHFQNKTPDHYKNFLSWDVLLRQRGAHHAYRMALKNTKGTCIPALEVHVSDLIRAHEGNPNVNLDDPSKIHWGKFNMFGRLIQTTTHCQIQCQTNPEYCLPSRDRILKVIFNEYVMSEEMQISRMAPLPDSDLVEEPFRSTLPRCHVSIQHSLRKAQQFFTEYCNGEDRPQHESAVSIHLSL
ncbi:ras GEF [Suillus brevipes Sb2]|nr:ras GEF [Suillus brevipes Sb2]